MGERNPKLYPVTNTGRVTTANIFFPGRVYERRIFLARAIEILMAQSLKNSEASRKN